MSNVKRIVVKEELAELQKLHRKAAHHLRPRIKMLLVALQKDGHSKSALARQLRVSPTSVGEWKHRYEQRVDYKDCSVMKEAATGLPK